MKRPGKLRVPIWDGEPPRLQAKPSGGPKGRCFPGSSCSRRDSRLQPMRRMEALAFRRGWLTFSLA
jgi:hypothetical protein